MKRVRNGTFSREKLEELSKISARALKTLIKSSLYSNNKQSGLEIITAQISKLQAGLQEERQVRKQLQGHLSQNIGWLESRLHVILVQEGKLRRESEERLFRFIEQRTRNLKEEMICECESSHISLQRLRQYNDVEVPRLYQSLRQNIRLREQSEDQIIQKTSNEFSVLNQIIAQEQKQREEAEENMLSMLNEIVNRVKEQLHNQKNERGEMQQMLIGVLEKTCSKLSATSLK